MQRINRLTVSAFALGAALLGATAIAPQPVFLAQAQAASAYIAPTIEFSELTSTSVRVSWKVAKGFTKYRLQTFDGSVILRNDTLSTTSKVISGLKPGTSHHFRVAAMTGSTTHGFSSKQQVTTLPATPNMPTARSLTANIIDVSWRPVPSAKSYRVQVRRSGSLVKDVTTTGTDTSITGLVGGTTYTVAVAAANSRTGGYSPSRTVTTIPSAPGLPTISGLTSVAATVTWPAVAGATSYQVVLTRAGKTVGTYPAPAAKLAFTGLLPGMEHVVQVIAVNGSGAGVASTARAFTTFPAGLQPPTISELSAAGFRVKWAAVASTTAYRVQVLDGDAVVRDQLVTPPLLTYMATGLAPGTVYTARVSATNSSGQGPWAGSEIALTFPGAASAPVVHERSGSAATLTWAPVTSAESYEVRVSKAGVPVYQRTVPSASVALTGLSPGMNYEVKVAAVNQSGQGAWSATGSFSTSPTTTPGGGSSGSGAGGGTGGSGAGSGGGGAGAGGSGVGSGGGPGQTAGQTPTTTVNGWSTATKVAKGASVTLRSKAAKTRVATVKTTVKIRIFTSRAGDARMVKVTLNPRGSISKTGNAVVKRVPVVWSQSTKSYHGTVAVRAAATGVVKVSGAGLPSAMVETAKPTTRLEVSPLREFSSKKKGNDLSSGLQGSVKVTPAYGAKVVIQGKRSERWVTLKTLKAPYLAKSKRLKIKLSSKKLEGVTSLRAVVKSSHSIAGAKQKIRYSGTRGH